MSSKKIVKKESGNVPSSKEVVQQIKNTHPKIELNAALESALVKAEAYKAHLISTEVLSAKQRKGTDAIKLIKAAIKKCV
jgi:hypothetical protein